jgi:glycerophosphoryl diester phosphodiesterase
LSPLRQTRLDALFAKPFAHRGLHGRGILENSRAAFRAAIQAGHGIELDVQATEIGEAIVFHDYALDRLTDEQGCVADLSIEQARAIRLRSSEETIPTLEEVLHLIDGRAPLLIEVKTKSPAYYQLCHWIEGCLQQYSGPVGVMSFNPRVGAWFARHYPERLRGLVVTEEGIPRRGRLKRRLSLWWSRADFLAYDIRDLPSAFAAASGLKIGTWTVRTEAQRATAAQHADQIIYEVQP